MTNGSQALMARTYHPPFSNFLFTNLFSIKFLYFFIISSLFPYFNLFVSIFIQSYVNIKLHVSTLYRSQAHGAWISFPPPPFLYYPLFFLQNIHIDYSFFKIFIIIRFSSFDNISRCHTSWIIGVFCVHSFYTVSVEKVWTQNTRIIHDVWRRLLILSNEEKRMIMKILKKEWFIWKFWKRR